MKFSNKGFTLVEVLAVVVIISILSAIAVPSVLRLIEKSKADFCEVNRLEIERMYQLNLDLEGKVHSIIEFEEYLLDYGNEHCPAGGIYGYVDGAVNCSNYSNTDDEIEDPDKGDNGVPFYEFG
ncbi:prepilin-type N-terminal cleavage/methylation domain-containing protein [Bacillus sp. B15-48]|nr:prepilin-type N-terminal cleavage/methylation domain-containing protein [Bacillus sp. B15-48]